RRNMTRLRKLSCQDHFSASSGTTLSGFSTGLAGSNITRLLKQGELGKTTEMVAASCTAKPWDRSSRSITLRVPPGLPAGMGGGSAGGRGRRAGALAPRLGFLGRLRRLRSGDPHSERDGDEGSDDDTEHTAHGSLLASDGDGKNEHTIRCPRVGTALSYNTRQL